MSTAALLFNMPFLLLADHPRTGSAAIVYYVLAAILAITVLIGIAMMSKVKTAVNGNLLGAISMLLMIVLTLWYWNIFSFVELYIAMLIGAGIGIWLSVKVTMLQMPQMVGMLNGLGGAASMLAGILTLIAAGDNTAIFELVTAGLAIFVGSLTLTGSMVAAGKLHNIIAQKPVVLKRHALWTGLSLAVSLLVVVLMAIPAILAIPALKVVLILISAVVSGAFGIIFAIRVGGADMPITISLLNSLSGVAGAIAGLAISDPLLVSVGAIVGASGLLLTQIMCRSMNRKLIDILLGKTSTPQQKTAAPVAAVASPAEEVVPAQTEEPNFAVWLQDAKRVIIVPGYGMALAQAQTLVKTLADELEASGKDVQFAIHPVAGRMPGHMNVLLAEVDVPYEKLHEMDDINPTFKDTDVAIVIGANDVVNPAANTAEGTPIYGMPILNVGEAKHVIICNFDKKPGYAGVDNPLYKEGREAQIALLLGDAKETLQTVLDGFRKPASAPTVSSSLPAYASWLADAKRVIIVPGYGMALAQAQTLVKSLADDLESVGKDVQFAIHPVAGRMPGHMNVLLAEVDVPYEKLHEMDDINPAFKDTDVAIVIGANDVVNPAANTAEGTPIYGMPILNVGEAKHVIICNFDKKPGYAGVDNPLYDEGRADIALLLGDAKETLRTLQDDYHKAQATEQEVQVADTSTPAYAKWLSEANRIIVVPGYGMALAQAQSLVKSLTDALEAAGKDVQFAIHPVAGRMPGHMNVLLAEVDVPYEKLREMDDINPAFKDTDVAIVIGANDVINPAANTAAGTPIYGMPILNVAEAKHVIICNFDKKPGYAGVDNPLYEDGREADIALLLGDAKESLTSLLQQWRE